MSLLGRLFEPPADEIKLSRPPTLLERLGAAFSRVFGVFGAVAAVALSLFLVVVGIPSWIAVPRSAAYRAAVEYALTNRDLGEHLGPVLECDGLPTAYRIEGGDADFRLGVRGEINNGRLDVHVVRTATAPAEVWHVTSGTVTVHLRGVKVEYPLKTR